MNRFYVSFALLLFIGPFTGCQNGEQEVVAAPPQVRLTNVVVYPIRPDSLIQYSRLPATVVAWKDITISALEAGVVETILKEMGENVQRGDVLARLRADVLEAAAIEAEANLKFQTYNFERSEGLYKEGSISEQAYFAAEYDFKRSKSNAQVIRERLSYTHIRAPFSGRIAHRQIEVGQLIPVGGATFRLVQTNRLKVGAWVPENEIADFQVGTPVEIRFNTYSDRIFHGEIGRIGPAAQPNRRVFPLEIHLSNPNNLLHPGMIGRLKTTRKVFQHTVVIPREAIVERETGPAAFVVEEDIARLRQLGLGPSEGDRVLVEKGLVFGDQLILKGGRNLTEGDRVHTTQGEIP